MALRPEPVQMRTLPIRLDPTGDLTEGIATAKDLTKRSLTIGVGKIGWYHRGE
jgi:hypothetical protein